MAERVAFIGLGVMGYPMAGHLAAAGHTVTVYNRTAARAQEWVQQHGGSAAITPAAAASQADVVFCCVGNDDDVRAVVAAPDGALAGMKPGALLVDHTTASARLARELAALCGQQEAQFVDAPVSGGQAGAEQGTLSIMCGGEPAAYERVTALLDCYGGYMRLLGPAGAGQMAKMVNQVCIAGLVQALAEGLHFAQSAGLDVAAVVDVISRGAAQSWQMTNRSATMTEGRFDFGFAIDWMRKDLAIAFEEAQRNGAQLPVTKIVDGFYAELQRRGHGRWDTSALIALLADQA